MIVYKITNNINGKSYIGQTVNLKKRLCEHKRARKNTAISHAINKYGFLNFSVEILSYCVSRVGLNKMEQFYINSHNTTVPFGYNIRSGGGQGHTCSVGLRKLISENTKSAMNRPEVRYNMLKNRPDYKPNSGSFKMGQSIRSKPVLCSNGVVFSSQLEASKFLEVSKSSIHAQISGRIKSVKGFTFVKIEKKERV